MKVYMVGGCVRDKVLNRDPVDIDYVVVGATDQQMIDMGYNRVGNDFSVYLHPKTGAEYALARTERKVSAGHTGFETDVSPSITLEEDLIRRDLTINAMAIEVLDWNTPNQRLDTTIIDPYGGLQDLKNKMLRHVSNAFAEDPLRVLRVARFAARYNFAVAPETLELMKHLADSKQLLDLTAERVYKELSKALQEPFTERFFEVLDLVTDDGVTKYDFIPNELQDMLPHLKEIFCMIPDSNYNVQMKLALLNYTSTQLDNMKISTHDRRVFDWVHDIKHQYIYLIGFEAIITDTAIMERFVRSLDAFKLKYYLQLVKQTFFVFSNLNNWYYPRHPCIYLLRKLATTDILDNMLSISSKDIENIEQYSGKEIGDQIVKLRAQYLLDMLQ